MGEVEGGRKGGTGETATGNNDTHEVDSSIKLIKKNISQGITLTITYYYCFYH